MENRCTSQLPMPGLKQHSLAPSPRRPRIIHHRLNQFAPRPGPLTRHRIPLLNHAWFPLLLSRGHKHNLLRQIRPLAMPNNLRGRIRQNLGIP